MQNSYDPDQPTEGNRIENTEESPYQFLTFTEFQQTTNPETRSRVRSHVMHGVHRRRRQRRGKGRGIELDTSSLLQTQITGPSQQPGSSGSIVALPSPGALGASRVDPFMNYPIQMNQRTYELFDHLRGDFCPMFKTMYMIGFFRTMTDAAGFQQVLCTSASHMTMLRTASPSEDSEAISLSNRAIQSVNSRLGDPVQCLGDGIVATILAFCFHSILFNDPPGSVLHLNGLEEIIRRRGGLNTLASSPILRTILFWADTNIALITDSTPRFQPPHDLLPELNMQPIEHTANHLANSCEAEDLLTVMNHLYTLNQLVMDQMDIANLWEDAIFAGNYVVPLLHRLLSMRQNIMEQDAIISRQEASRIGAIIYLNAIRGQCGVDFSPNAQVRNLKEALLLWNIEQGVYNPPLLLWLLVLGSTQSKNEEHEWFTSRTAESIVTLGCSSWGQVMNNVREVLWVEGLLQVECELLHQEISTIIRNSHGSLFL